MNKLDAKQRSKNIRNFCKVSAKNKECYVYDMKWFAKAYKGAAGEEKDESLTAKVNPLSEMRIKYLNAIATYLRRWVGMFSGYSEKVERSALYKQKLDEAELPKVER